MSDEMKSKAAAVAAKIAGQAATIGASGVPVGPLVEAVVKGVLGELLSIQDEQLAILRNIERDVSQLVEGPYRTAREMLERAMIPGRQPDAIKADLQRASDEFLRAAAQYRDATQSQASAYMQASLVLGLLGDQSAMRYYADKAWKDGIAALESEADETTDLLRHSANNRAKRLAGFWSLEGTRRYFDHFQWLKWGIPGPSLAERFPEARAIERVRESGRQVDVYRDVVASLSDGPDVLPYYWVVAELADIKMVPPCMRVYGRLYRLEQLVSRRHEFGSLMGKLGIDGHLYGSIFPASPVNDAHDGFLFGIYFGTLPEKDDPRVGRFAEEVKRIFPYGLPISEPWPNYPIPSPLVV